MCHVRRKAQASAPGMGAVSWVGGGLVMAGRGRAQDSALPILRRGRFWGVGRWGAPIIAICRFENLLSLVASRRDVPEVEGVGDDVANRSAGLAVDGLRRACHACVSSTGDLCLVGAARAKERLSHPHEGIRDKGALPVPG